jgi:two-component system, LuxR family, sensor kinase FixL
VDPVTGLIVDANPAAAAFYGYPRDRLRAMKISELSLAPAGHAGPARRRPAGGEPAVEISLHRLANGEDRAVEVHSSTVPVRGQRLLVSIVHDVTERKRLEKQVLDISERERQHLGQDLHDSLGGKLAGAALMSKALSQTLRAKSAQEAVLAEEIVGCINESIVQARSIARGLCQVDFTVSGLTGGLAEFASETRKRFGISCWFRADDQLQISDVSVATHLFRIVQEAVTNAIRHGRAGEVLISLTRAGKHFALEVRDDGVGLPSDPKASQGLGLRTMKHRAGVIGAQLTVGPGAGGGTVVSCLLPAASVARKKAK